MPKVVALFSCIAFVFFMLRVERKQAPKIPLTSWIPTIWMLIIASKPLATWFGASVDTTGGSPFDRVVFSALLCLGLIMLAKRKFDWHSAIRSNVCLSLVIGFMLVSILWSSVLYISFRRWIREILAVVMAFLVLTEREPREVILSIFRRSIYILIPFSLLLVRYYPQYGVQFSRWTGERMWIGVTLQKNGLGRLCMFSIMFIVWTFVRRWQGREITFVKYRALGEVLLVVMTLWLLKGPSQKAASATALAALASGLAVFAVLLWTKKSRIKLGMILFPTIIVFIIGFGIVTMIAGGSTVASFTSAFGRDDTLTGRSDIWAVLVPVFEHKPLLGSGFGSFWTSQTRDLYEMGEAHSGYLDVLLELGFVGIVLITIFLVSTCIKALKELNYDFDWASLFISYLIMALVHNISESSFNSFTNQLTAALLFMAVSLTLSAPLAPGVPTKRRRDIAECCG